LPALKDVATGAKKGGVILQPMEYFTLRNLDQPWTKSLNVWHTSAPVPSAPLLVFGNDNEEIVRKFKTALLYMHQARTER